MQDYTIAVEENPAPEHVAVVSRGLGDYNFAQTQAQGRWFSTFLRDSLQNILGGTHGWTFGNYMYVELLWVHESLRGQGHGRRLLLAAEREGVARGCRYSVLSTFSFQARGFYEKLGYRVFGELDDVVDSHRWYFLRKLLIQEEGESNGS
jgi:ribosomal protein S18 acetylase RimI-like enzyme